MNDRNQQQLLRVEVYSHGGWWKDSTGRTGQVAQAQASKGPMATVAAIANSFGVDGWQLTDMVSAHHNTYLLSFALASVPTETTRLAGPEQPVRRPVSTSIG